MKKTFREDYRKYDKAYGKIAKKADAKVAQVYADRNRKLDKLNKKFISKHPGFGKAVLAIGFAIMVIPVALVALVSKIDESNGIKLTVNED